MLKEAFDWIANKAATKIVEVRGAQFTSEKLDPIRVDIPRVSELQCHSLQGVCDYLNQDIERLNDGSFIHIVSPNIVRIKSPFFGETRERETYLEAVCKQDPINTNWMSTAEMIIHLVTHFSPNEDSDSMVKILSSLVSTTTIGKSYDGLSQQVVVKNGIATQTKIEIKPIRTLKPIRTFSEIEPCEEMFLLRLKQDGPNFSAKLTEADGMKWQEEARRKIAAYIFGNCQKDIKIVF
jgi:hypothetical protein